MHFSNSFLHHRGCSILAASFCHKGGFGKGFVLAGVPSGSWNYNSDDELTNETYDQDGNVTGGGAGSRGED